MRVAFDGPDGSWRVTFDRQVRHNGSTLAVSDDGLLLPAVVVELKGEVPKRILKALGRPNKKFSKSRWALASDARVYLPERGL